MAITQLKYIRIKKPISKTSETELKPVKVQNVKIKEITSPALALNI